MMIASELEKCTAKLGAVQGTGKAEVSLFTGGRDRPYAAGLVRALAARGLSLQVVGGDELDGLEFHSDSKLEFINLHGKADPNASRFQKLQRALAYYGRAVRFTAGSRTRIFHTLWNGKLEFLDRTLLIAYFKLLGKKTVFTAHNVNAGRRDSTDSWINRFTLRVQYSMIDHIFVHTNQMKSELTEGFKVGPGKVTVIPFGINDAVPQTALTASEAKWRLGLEQRQKTILFFGNIGPYKGLEDLVAAFKMLRKRSDSYRLLIAGKHRTGAEEYVRKICNSAARDVANGSIIQRIEHIPDSETELYFKAADLLVLPYTFVSQSGVLFLGQSFGLPVVATDVGSLREHVIENETGFLCKPSDPADLARVIERYFESDLFKYLPLRRQEIKEESSKRQSWDLVGEMTQAVYSELLGREG